MKLAHVVRQCIAMSAVVLAGVAGCTDSVPTSSETASSKVSQGGTMIYGLTADNMLLTFSAEKPNQVQDDVAITGLASGETIMGIDFRASDATNDGVDKVGLLYGVSSAGTLYVINPATGAVTSAAQLSTAITGGVAGFGFNPVVDRIRIHGSDQQNLRINPDNGATTVDAALAYMATDVNSGQTPMIAALAYINSDNDAATGTALYAIDAGRDVLVDLPNANAGQLRTIGSLGVDAGSEGGFDIVGTAGGTAYAALQTSASGKSTLYSINLMTGKATSLGLIAQSRSPFISIAVAP